MNDDACWAQGVREKELQWFLRIRLRTVQEVPSHETFAFCQHGQGRESRHESKPCGPSLGGLLHIRSVAQSLAVGAETIISAETVSYTHLTLPTILLV
eukprot:3994539-Amphidinium_carterae.1